MKLLTIKDFKPGDKVRFIARPWSEDYPEIYTVSSVDKHYVNIAQLNDGWIPRVFEKINNDNYIVTRPKNKPRGVG